MRLSLGRFTKPDGSETVVCDSSHTTVYMAISAEAQNAGMTICQTARLSGPDVQTVLDLYIADKILPIRWDDHLVPRNGGAE